MLNIEDFINNFQYFNKIVVFDFKLGDGGIGDYLKFFMIALEESIVNKKRIYCKLNNLEIQKYIKFKYDFFNITDDEISKIKKENLTIKKPYDYYNQDKYNGNISLNNIFYFDDIVKLNVKNILDTLPNSYISIHLRMGDKYLETDKKYVLCKTDQRVYKKDNIFNFIENNKDNDIIFFCDNNMFKLKLKNKYKNIIITDAQIGHTSLVNTCNDEVLDAVTEFYLLSNSKSIYGASYSGFSIMASKFNNVEYINLTI